MVNDVGDGHHGAELGSSSLVSLGLWNIDDIHVIDPEVLVNRLDGVDQLSLHDGLAVKTTLESKLLFEVLSLLVGLETFHHSSVIHTNLSCFSLNLLELHESILLQDLILVLESIE